MAMRGGDDAGFRANMERKRIINARQTVMRQRKWKDLKLKLEEDEKRLVKDALDRRKKERARLTAYIHPKSQAAPPSPPKVEQLPSRSQNFAARLKENVKSAATENSFLEHGPRNLFFGTATHLPERLPLNSCCSLPSWNGDETRPMTASCIGHCNVRNQRTSPTKGSRVTFDPALLPKDSSGCPQRDADLLTKASARPQSPTIVLDGPDFDSSSNSSFHGHNVENAAEEKPRVSRNQPASIDDINTFLEEALKLRLDTETATTRMIAELTGLGTRLDECGVRPTDGRNGSVPENRFLLTAADSGKVHRSEAWEICVTEHGGIADYTKRQKSESGVIVYSGYSSVFPPRGKRSRPGSRADESRHSKDSLWEHIRGEKTRKADLLALSEQENTVVASIERLDYRLATAIARCREVGVPDGRLSCASAPTIIGEQSKRVSRAGRKYGSCFRRMQGYQSTRDQAAYMPMLSRRRQNVGLTNKCLEKLDTKSQLRLENDPPQIVEEHCGAAAVAAASGFNDVSTTEGVIVFHPDAYHLINPVGSP